MLPQNIKCPPHCFQGSTEFYVNSTDDEFTPDYSQAEPLVDHVGMQWPNGSYPPWIDPDSNDTSVLQYVEWFNGIWHTGDPSTWNETVFTAGAVMIDSSGISTGAKHAADRFLLIFKYFPGLRGEVVSWAANEREILINWRFQVLKKDGKTFFHVPVIDKFSFVKGRVSFRVAYFDLVTFVGYLSQTYGLDQLTDFLLASFKQSARTGGIQSLPRMIWNLLSGLLFWPETPNKCLRAEPNKSTITLHWDKIDEATAYKITRATSIDGDFVPAVLDDEGKEVPIKEPIHTFVDKNVDSDKVYWYLLSPVFGPVGDRPGHLPVHTPVLPNQPMSTSPTRRKRLKQWGFTMK